MVTTKYRPEVRCRTCERKTRSPTGLCKPCRVGDDREPGQPTVEEMAAYYRMKERAIRDCGLNPLRSQAGDVDDVMARERIPDVLGFLTIYRGADDDVSVVQGGGGGVAGVCRLPGPAGAAVAPGDPGERECRTAGAVGGADADHPADGAHPTAVLEVRPPGEQSRAGQVRVTRYWMGVPAGSRAEVVAVEERAGVTLVAVLVRDSTLFGRTVLVPAAYTETAQ